MAEITSHDKTGQGLIAIPAFLMLVTPIHCGIVFLIDVFLFFKGVKQSFKTVLFNVLAVVGTNAIAFFADILLVIIVFNILSKLGLIH